MTVFASDIAIVDPPAPTDPPTDPPVVPDPVDPADLGDAGKKALDAERKARKAAERDAADARARIKEFEDKDKSEAEKAAARAEAAEKALAEVTAREMRLRVATEVGLTADLHEFLTGSDEESLRAQADKLKAATATGRTPQPDPSQGARPDGAPAQLTRADLVGMTPDQIVAAKAAGRLNTALGIK